MSHSLLKMKTPVSCLLTKTFAVNSQPQCLKSPASNPSYKENAVNITMALKHRHLSKVGSIGKHKTYRNIPDLPSFIALLKPEQLWVAELFFFRVKTLSSLSLLRDVLRYMSAAFGTCKISHRFSKNIPTYQFFTMKITSPKHGLFAFCRHQQVGTQHWTFCSSFHPMPHKLSLKVHNWDLQSSKKPRIRYPLLAPWFMKCLPCRPNSEVKIAHWRPAKTRSERV